MFCQSSLLYSSVVMITTSQGELLHAVCYRIKMHLVCAFFTLIECEILHAEDLQKTMCIFCCVLPQIAISQTQDAFLL